MKAYVIITLNLCAMHGANMYIYNKTNFMKELGWKVYVYSAEQGEILIPGLKEYKRLQSTYLRFYPSCFRTKGINAYIEKIKKDVDADNCEQIVIESTNFVSSMWGELIASALNCKHISFILQERFNFSKEEKEYVRYKLGRHELAGITDTSVNRMLNDDTFDVKPEMIIRAFCNNTIDNCEDNFSNKLNPDAEMTIGSIGRLEKPYVISMLQELKKTMQDGRKYNLVMIGGTRAEKTYSDIKKIFKDLENVNLIFTGYIFPIPKTLVDNCDIFISASGSANATYMQHRPTINLNPNDGSIIGVIGLTYEFRKQSIYDSNYDISKLADLINLTIEKKDEIRYVDIMTDGSYKQSMREEFERHLQIANLSPAGSYFDVLKIKYQNKSYKAFNVLGKIVGPDALYKGIDRARRMFK